jgi:hypothetical protein
VIAVAHLGALIPGRPFDGPPPRTILRLSLESGPYLGSARRWSRESDAAHGSHEPRIAVYAEPDQTPASAVGLIPPSETPAPESILETSAPAPPAETPAPLLTVQPPATKSQAKIPSLFRAEQLDQLLAPIAPHPDALLAQILMAATYPLEVVKADRWVQAQRCEPSRRSIGSARQCSPGTTTGCYERHPAAWLSSGGSKGCFGLTHSSVSRPSAKALSCGSRHKSITVKSVKGHPPRIVRVGPRLVCAVLAGSAPLRSPILQ